MFLCGSLLFLSLISGFIIDFVQLRIHVCIIIISLHCLCQHFQEPPVRWLQLGKEGEKGRGTGG